MYKKVLTCNISSSPIIGQAPLCNFVPFVESRIWIIGVQDQDQATQFLTDQIPKYKNITVKKRPFVLIQSDGITYYRKYITQLPYLAYPFFSFL